MKLKFISLLACTIGIVTSCNKPAETNAGGKPESKSRGTIGVSLLTLDNPFFKVIGDNITAEGRKNGYETVVVSGDQDGA